MPPPTPPALPKYSGGDIGGFMAALVRQLEQVLGQMLASTLPRSDPVASGSVTATAFVVTAGGPTWTSGTPAPSSVQPVGSLYSRIGGAVGATLYVSRGGGVWNPVAGV